MARRTYTLTELMGLRANQASGEITAMAGNPALADIVRRSGSESSSASGSSSRPSTTRHKDDSSVASDELVFKGTVSRRMGRELARKASQNSMRFPTRETREPARDLVRDTSQEAPLDPSRPMEWKYRGRSDTEAATAEPIPAPTGASAQRDEGFQRFYKAVVSPTHVRVTAGGRIVPNTRGPPSPTIKRTSDSSVMDNHSAPDKTVVSKPPVAPVAPVGLSQPVPALPQLVTGYPPGFQPMQAPVSFVPMTLGTHFMHSTKAADDDKQGKVKPSLPEPFYYNGQLMYAFPGPLGNSVVPVHMVGIPQGVAPHPPAHYMAPQPTQTSSAATGSTFAPSNRSLSGIPPVANHIVPANANFNGAAAAPISSIKPSDITRKQIASFKQNLKYHDDQLQYNRHQIDEKEMEQRIQVIKGHIQKFEATLRTQLEYERAHCKTTQGQEDKRLSQPVTAAEETLAPSKPPAPMAPMLPMAPLVFDHSEKRFETSEANRRILLASYGLNTNIGEGGKAMFRSPTKATFPGVNGFPNAVGLPSDAALAPVFQPRGYASTWTGSKYAREMKAYQEAEKRLLATESKSLEHMRMTEQRSVSQPFAVPMAPAAQTNGNPNAFNHPSRSSGNTAKQQFNFGVPYLLGTLPKGVNPRTARDQDYVYKRPLTEEERRARFLYWGKAPKSAVTGLPKFDGKHFYPPSPVKERSAEPVRESGSRTTDSDCDPFRTMTPTLRADSKGVSASEDNCTVGRLTRSISFETQVNSGSEDFITGGAPLECCEDGVDANAVGAAERRTDNAGAKLWQAVLKKAPTSSALDISSGKFSDVPDLVDINGVVVSTAPEKRGENRPPGNVSSLEDQFKHLTVDAASRRNLTSTFNM
ncbi:hypothetical protein C8A00DRAFT_12694 [Chaetomidium leptoderma]|uniref:Uncharacterized protein n=1 Tax=Chaetomidium leptoderma TaxID=669021 RepID=A0AAN6VS94_9PEZI|nr:hypothetical protein C8A00DRAFT_12694 [Chaetomidium leptoderma]